MRADLCIEGYPERNTPTILIYKDGEIRRQLVTLQQLNGPRTSLRDIERLLVEVGAVNGNDMRLKRKESDEDLNTRNNDGKDDDDGGVEPKQHFDAGRRGVKGGHGR